MDLNGTQTANLREMRAVFDGWFDSHAEPPYDREAGWLRLVAAVMTESQFLILAHTGGWDGGDRTNTAQRQVLAASAQLYRDATGRDPDGYGSNGGSVGALQQIPTPVAQLKTAGGIDGATPQPWDGWGSVVDCMVLATSVPKYLIQLRVTSDSTYKGKQMASAVVADLLRVQQPAANEVAQNYGVGITERASAIAQQFPQGATAPPEDGWLIDMAVDQVALDKYKGEIADAVAARFPAIPAQVVPLRRIHFYDQTNLTGLHGVANLDAGVWYFVPGADIELHWGVQKSLFGDGAKDWNEIQYSAGSTNVVRTDVFGVQVHVYPEEAK